MTNLAKEMTSPSTSQSERDEQLPLAAFLDRYVQESEEGIKRHSEALRAQYERPSPMRWPITAFSVVAAGAAGGFAVAIGKEAIAGFGCGALFILALGLIALVHKTPRL